MTPPPHSIQVLLHFSTYSEGRPILSTKSLASATMEIPNHSIPEEEGGRGEREQEGEEGKM